MKLGALASLRQFGLRHLHKLLGTNPFLSMQIDITNACNLSCKHCYHAHHDNAGALDFAGWQVIFDQYDALLTKLGLRPSIVICGGEPFLSPMLEPILEDIKKRWGKCFVSILTNGTLVRAERLKMFDGLNVTIQVSLDGPDAARHDAIRGKGSFARTMRGIETFKAHGLDVKALAVLSTRSAPWVGKFFDRAKIIGLTQMNFTRMVAQGTGKAFVAAGEDSALEGFALRDALSSTLVESKKSGVFTNTDKPLYHLLDPKLGSHGRMAIGGFVVDYKGNFKVSSRVDVSLGNVLKDGLENIFLNHFVMKSLRDGKIEGCGGCKFYSKCGGDRNVAFANSGSFLARDPGCWLVNS